MSDTRPANCRFRLQDEGKPYPRSSCSSCGATVMTGLGRHCSKGTYQPTTAAVEGEPPMPKKFGTLLAEGMPLRDWFAGQALASIMPMADQATVAEYAYRVADAMIAERDK